MKNSFMPQFIKMPFAISYVVSFTEHWLIQWRHKTQPNQHIIRHFYLQS